MMRPVKEWGMDSPRSVWQTHHRNAKEKVKFKTVSRKMEAGSGFRTVVEREKYLEKERGTMIFQKVLFRTIYKDSRGEKNSRKVSCTV